MITQKKAGVSECKKRDGERYRQRFSEGACIYDKGLILMFMLSNDAPSAD
tara:strand:- start:184 stop:333 length:150 start_codon:yes stop_codon:yes gene_type:complete